MVHFLPSQSLPGCLYFFFWQCSVLVMCISMFVCVCLPPCCAHHSHQLDPVTDVCAVVGIWKGVQQQLMNAVCIPAAPIHQRDKDVSHSSGAC